MNIFILDLDLKKCAQYHADQHVNKMILEGTQILCTVLSNNGIISPYKPFSPKHPCIKWAGRSLSNWKWLRLLIQELNEESKYRYKKTINHKSAVVARSLPEPTIPDIGLTDFAQAMPDRFKVEGDAVRAYRSYYKEIKSKFISWKYREEPLWYKNGGGGYDTSNRRSSWALCVFK